MARQEGKPLTEKPETISAKPETFSAPEQKKPATPSRKRLWLILGIGGGVLILAAVLGFVFLGGDSGSTINTNNNTETRQTDGRALDGVLVDPAEANPYPIALMIENIIMVRPQSGLAEASVVYEALAEGGITRFMAVYGLTKPIDRIGPVRSARPYFLDWALEYGALYVHVGGSPTALARINSEDVFDLNQFFNSQYFWRANERGLASEHTLFTSSELLTFALRDKEAPVEGDFDPWLFKDGSDEAERPQEQQTVIIDYSTFNYKVEYRYNRATNAYDRFQTDAPFLSSDVHISPANIIVQYVQTGLEDANRLTMTTTGSGDGVVFRDGQAIDVTWRKDGLTERTRFFITATGDEIQLNRGQTWVQVVPTTTDVTY